MASPVNSHACFLTHSSIPPSSSLFLSLPLSPPPTFLPSSSLFRISSTVRESCFPFLHPRTGRAPILSSAMPLHRPHPRRPVYWPRASAGHWVPVLTDGSRRPATDLSTRILALGARFSVPSQYSSFHFQRQLRNLFGFITTICLSRVTFN